MPSHPVPRLPVRRWGPLRPGRLASVLAVLVLVLPPSSANPPPSVITRTFDSLVLAEVDVLGGGTGIYSAAGPCPGAVFGDRVPVAASDVFYYQSDREATNFKMGDLFVAGLGPIPFLNQPCPVGGGVAPNWIVVEDLQVYAPYEGVVVDQLCFEPVFTCSPLTAGAQAVVYFCPLAATSFVPSPPDGKGIFPVTGIGSRSIVCTAPAGFVEYYDPAVGGLGYCTSWFFAADGWGTDDCIIQVEDIVPYGNGVDDTGYLITCMTAITLLGVFVTSHDYKLVLDLDDLFDDASFPTPDTWLAAKNIHWSLGGPNRLQGWHDLGGDNGCPNAFPAVLPGPPAKDTSSFPEFP